MNVNDTLVLSVFYNSQSLKFSQSVYDLPWYEHTARMQKNLLNVLAYQKPVVLSINCLVPELSLRYYCSVS